MAVELGEQNIEVMPDTEEESVAYHPPANISDFLPSGGSGRICGSLRKISDESHDISDCCTRIAILFLGSGLCTTLGFLVFGIPISMLVMGSLYWDSCPHDKMVPVYLVVGGATNCAYWLASMSMQIVKTRCSEQSSAHQTDEERGDHPACLIANTLMILFIVVWCIVGNLAVYSTWSDKTCPIYECDESNFCSPTLLLFSFWLLTCSYMLCGYCVLCGTGVTCMLWKCRRKRETFYSAQTSVDVDNPNPTGSVESVYY